MTQRDRDVDVHSTNKGLADSFEVINTVFDEWTATMLRFIERSKNKFI
jgi:hypothetical protein